MLSAEGAVPDFVLPAKFVGHIEIFSCDVKKIVRSGTNVLHTLLRTGNQERALGSSSGFSFVTVRVFSTYFAPGSTDA